jgi:HEAT repeat protein
MSRPRQRMFGPFTYAALLASGLVALYSGVEIATPRVENWLEQRRILKELRSPDNRTRQGVVLGLEHKSLAFAGAYLVEALGDPSIDVRLAACRALAHHGYEPQSLIPVLSAAADDEKIETRIETARILSRIMALAASKIGSSADGLADKAVQARSDSDSILYRLLKDRVPEVRAAAAVSLGDGGLDPSVAAELIAAAGDSDRSVRLEIARALLRINGPGDRTAADILTSLVADKEPVGDRSLALNALLKASEETRSRAMLPLVELISRADPAVQPDVIACLGEAGPHAHVALPALENLLDDPEPGTRAAAAKAILRIEASWNPPEPGMSASAFKAIPGSEQSKNPRLMAVMLEMVADKTLTQEWRMDILGRIKELAPAALTKATPGLIRQLGDSNSDVRRAALDLLSIIIEDTRAEMPNQADAR